MKLAPMRFDGLSLRHNPATLVISRQNNVREFGSPCCEADSISYGVLLRRVTGEGEFCGKDCMAQYQALERLHRTQKRAKLVLPQTEAMYAYLKELSMTAKPVNDVLSYRFVMIEARSPRRQRATAAYYLTEKAGESLWDIGYRYDQPVEKLVALNPQIKYIDELPQGERVRLC